MKHLIPNCLIMSYPQSIVERLQQFLKMQFYTAHKENAVLGLSGGIDSALVATLCAKTFGPEHVFPVLMPYANSSPQSIKDALTMIDFLKIPKENIRYVDITDSVNSYFYPTWKSNAAFVDSSFVTQRENQLSLSSLAGIKNQGLPAEKSETERKLRMGNWMARTRMMILYDVSFSVNGLVIGTGNKTECLLGYGTIYGDCACAMNPLGDLFKSEVYQLAKFLNIPQEIIDKTPSADLWVGQSDEDELGLSYNKMDTILHHLFGLNNPNLYAPEISNAKIASVAAIAGVSETIVEKLYRRWQTNQFKSKMPPVALL